MKICGECGERFGAEEVCPHDGTRLGESDDALLGTTIGSYRVAKLLGAGGMGRVYKGVHPGIGSRVAIKLLTGEFAQDRELIDRFFSEARAVNLIRHEGIVNIVDLASLSDGRPYIIMEYLDGMPLSRVLHDSAVPLGDLCSFAVQILGALGAAHGKGIIHRDLKPDNVFVSPSGRVKVLDFGIAKLTGGLDTKPGPTRTGSLLGTPYYMSPEQCLGQQVDGRADLYAMGVILYEAVTGKVPFKADVLFELLRQQISERPVAPRSLRPDVPEVIEQIINRALEKDPGARFQNAADMAMALTHAAATLPADAYTARSTGGFGVISPRPTPYAQTAPSHPGVQTPSPHGQSSALTPGPWQVTGTAHGQTVHRRKTAAWLALGAGLAVVAGVITFVVVTRSRGKPAAEASAGAGAGAEPGLPAPTEGATALPSTPGPSPAPAPVPVPVPAPGSGSLVPPPPQPTPSVSQMASSSSAAIKKPDGKPHPNPKSTPKPVAVVPPPGTPGTPPGTPAGSAQPAFTWTPEMGQALKDFSEAIQGERFEDAEKALSKLPDAMENKKELMRAIRLAKSGAIQVHKNYLAQHLRMGRCDLIQKSVDFFEKYSQDDVADGKKVLTECKGLSPGDLAQRQRQALDEIIKNVKWYLPGGNGRSMLAELKKAVPIAPGDPEVITLHVQAYCLEGEITQAQKWFAKVKSGTTQAELKDFCKKRGEIDL